MNKPAIILFAHGARDPEWADPLRRVLARMLDLEPQRRVELAFLEFMQPDLLQCVECLVQEGVLEIQVIPMFIAQGGHLKRDVPALVESLRQKYPGLCIRQAAAVGEADAVVAAMAQYALTA